MKNEKCPKYPKTWKNHVLGTLKKLVMGLVKIMGSRAFPSFTIGLDQALEPYWPFIWYYIDLYMSMKHNKINPNPSIRLHLRYGIAYDSPYAFLKINLIRLQWRSLLYSDYVISSPKLELWNPGSSARENTLWRAKTRALARSSQH